MDGEQPVVSLFSEDPRVLTQLELEARLEEEPVHDRLAARGVHH